MLRGARADGPVIGAIPGWGAVRDAVRRPGADRAPVEVEEVLVEVAPPATGIGDHRVEAGTLGDEGLDLPVDAGGGVLEQRTSLGLVTGRSEPLSIALARGLVLEQLADLGEREPGVVAEGADEAQALEVGRVEQAVCAV